MLWMILFFDVLRWVIKNNKIEKKKKKNNFIKTGRFYAESITFSMYFLSPQLYLYIESKLREYQKKTV